MSIGTIEYAECPYCPMKYKGKSKVNLDAIAGHIELKHKEKPAVKTGKDFVVEIPEKVKLSKAEAKAQRLAELEAKKKELEAE